MKNLVVISAFLAMILMATLASCNNDRDGAVKSIQAYLQALVDKDSERIVHLACADWEAGARTDLESFTAVSVALQDLNCQETGIDGDTALVSCSGKITANYGNEVLEIDLSERTFQAVYEAGEWRMCGYR
jgi:hypothetical protein